MPGIQLCPLVCVRLPSGLLIADSPVCASHGKIWAPLPAKAILDRDGRHVEENGRRKYVPILSWAERATTDRFSAAVIELVRARHPNALDTTEAA